MRPLGGWLADKRDPIRLLVGMFGVGAVLTLLLVGEMSFTVQMTAVYGLALLAGASAATVVKLIPSYFPHAVGAVSGLAKAAGAACGFTMSVTMAFSKDVTGGYQMGFMLWAAMNIGSLLLVAVPALWRQQVASSERDPHRAVVATEAE
jgi:NNP family nitrate/nitrite transporter-like MFS transporter